jgi:hypothetical protein
MPTEPLPVPYRKSIEAHHRDLLCAFRSSQILPYKPPTPKQNCHPDRSAAKWRDLQFHSRTQRISRMQRTISHLPFTVESDGYLSEVLSIHIANATQSTTLPLVIPTEAQRSGGICSAPFGPPESSVTHPSAQTELSSRPQRSEVEGPAVRLSALPNPPLHTPAPKQNCHPDRSVAKWRDLLFPSATNQPSLREPISPLSSRPKRSGAEGSAVPLPHATNLANATNHFPFAPNHWGRLIRSANSNGKSKTLR